MTMKLYLRRAAAALTAVAISLGCPAASLPAKTINGKSYYYYAVKKGDTVLSIARALGVTRDDIIKHNPSAADILRAGASLYFPVDVFKDIISVQNALPQGATADAGSIEFYTVQRGETLFGISHRLGVDPQAIIALNPGIDKGVKAGQTIKVPAAAGQLTPIPDDASLDRTLRPVNTPAKEYSLPSGIPADSTLNRSLRPVSGPVKEYSVGSVPDDASLDRTLRPVSPTLAESARTEQTASSVALLLPLNLYGDPKDKNARSATEFAKGFLLGLKQYEPQSPRFSLYIYDSTSDPDTISALLGGRSDLDLIITADNQAALSATLAAAGKNTYVLNLGAVQDTSWVNDSRSMQFNAPHDVLYSKAADALLERYAGYTPVMLISKGGRSEKLPFTDYLRRRYAALEIEPRDISFDGNLSKSNLDGLDMSERYVFIPASGALTEFNKISRTLRNLANENPGQIALFGYPDWTTFRGDALENLHSLGASIYSRFYADPDSYATRAFAAAFEQEYGSAMLEQVPSQAMLGYDTARYLIENLSEGRGKFDGASSTPVSGLQSTFHFGSDSEGPANKAVYIITFLPGSDVDVEVR